MSTVQILCKAGEQETYSGREGTNYFFFPPKSTCTIVLSKKIVFSLLKLMIKQRWVIDDVLAEVQISRADFANHNSLDFEEMSVRSETFSKGSFRYGIQ